MCDSMCSKVLINMLLLFSGSAVTDEAIQFPVAWSEYSTLPFIRSVMPGMTLSAYTDGYGTYMKSVPPGRKNSIDNIMLRFYNGTSTDVTSSIQLSKSTRLLDAPGFDPQAPTVLYIHGYIELVSDQSVQTVASAYLQTKKEYNFVLLDWSNLAFGQYFSIVGRVRQVGEVAARQLSRLVNTTRLPLERLHVVGHSLGAHIAGQIGRSMRRVGHVLPRISALDPAYPGFYPALLGTPLRRSDAKFIDVIHTDAGMYGAPLSLGHVDFWPNGGLPKQPGCPSNTVFFTLEDFCSHYRSWQYWSESVRVRKAFAARRCADYSSFARGACAEKRTGYMGHDASTQLRGDYYLRTNEKSPFARNLELINHKV